MKMDCEKGIIGIQPSRLKRAWGFYQGYQPLLKFVATLLVPILLSPIAFHSQSKEAKAGYVLVLVSVFWCTEAIPLGVTGLIPALLLPLLGVTPSKEVSMYYMKENIMLSLAAYTVAVSVEKWNLHKRISLHVLLLIGFSPARLLLGFMLTCMLLSMWINNTATTTIMIPVVEAVLQQIRQHLVSQVEKTDRQGIDGGTTELKSSNSTGDREDNEPVSCGKMTDAQFQNICKAMCLCVAYGACFGGSATIIGTGAIILAKAQIEAAFEKFDEDPDFTFAKWSAYSLPISIISGLVAWLWLQFKWFGIRYTVRGWFGSVTDTEKETYLQIKQLLKTELQNMGRITFAEKAIVVHFVLMVFLWFFRRPGLFPGWEVFFDGYAGSSLPALAIAIWFFIFPCRSLYSRSTGWHYEPIMDIQTMSRKVPWHLLLLFGGGMALADACQRSGLSQLMGEKMVVLQSVPTWMLLPMVCLILSLMTELTSNVAVISITLPIIAEMAIVLQMNPMKLMIPATLACTYAFMLPAATPPNAIVFSYGHLKVLDMVKTGFALNIFSVFISVVATYAWGTAIFNLDRLPPKLLELHYNITQP